MDLLHTSKVRGWIRHGLAVLALALAGSATQAAETMPNACPVDGCTAKIISVKPAGDELEITFEANFTPDVSKNHLHVWWGDVYKVEQVGRNAQTVHGVTQGRWHRHDHYPVYVTQGAASTSVRNNTTTLCVSPADRNHNILDVKIYHCLDAGAHF